jgi:hypothetical protein
MRLRDLLDWPLVLLPTVRGRPISISLANETEREERGRRQLQRVLEQYDLRKWTFTSRVRIEQEARPHSHPVLTLNTAHPNDDHLVLANYLHEQIHWFLTRRRAQARRALKEVRGRYADPPVERSEGAASAESTYLHYLVCFLEYEALIEVVGADEARRVIEFWCTHHYTEIYRTVLRDAEAIREIVERHGLLPKE